jgi:hypothetical protein
MADTWADTLADTWADKWVDTGAATPPIGTAASGILLSMVHGSITIGGFS